MGTNARFSDEEKQQLIDYLKEHGTASNPQLANLIGRSQAGVRYMMRNISPHIFWRKIGDSKRPCWVYDDPNTITKVTCLNAGPDGTLTFDYTALFERLVERNRNNDADHQNYQV